MVIVALIPVLGGILVGWGGFLGWRGRLSRDRGTGVRTSATLRSDEAFALGNKVAGLPTMVAGAVGITAGIAALLMPSALGAVMAATMGVFGIGLLVGAGGLLGHRAAATMPQSPKPTGHAGCGGCACGGGGCGS